MNGHHGTAFGGPTPEQKERRAQAISDAWITLLGEIKQGIENAEIDPHISAHHAMRLRDNHSYKDFRRLIRIHFEVTMPPTIVDGTEDHILYVEPAP